jgi:hypothetical protein
MAEKRVVIGKEKSHPPRKHDHVPGFEAAFKKACDEAADAWGDCEVRVTFEASVKRNPGAVGEYRVKLTEI